MGIEENKEVVRRIFEEVRNGQIYDNVHELIHTDFVYSITQRDFKGPEGFKEDNMMWRTAFPDLHRTIFELVGDGEIVSVLDKFDGTNTGDFLGNAPTGNRVTYTMAHFFRFKDGKVVEMIPIANMLSLFQQLGVEIPNQQ